MTRVAIVDYGMGNRRSVEKALEHVGADVVRTAGHAELRAAERLVLPGVGAFPEAMRRLRALGLVEVLRERAGAGVPLLGICLGMQLLFDASTEHEGAEGLGLLPGEVTRLDPGAGGKLPHIGWNRVTFARASALGTREGEAAAYYHVHSFVCRPRDEDVVVGRGEYGETFASVVERDNVAGVQFHPEKSSHAGLELLAAFTGAGVASR
jgi:imidazole glycerol-phosphate synthase subunit HisH